MHTNTPQYATISENVEIARNLKKPWATSIINAIGRKILRYLLRTRKTSGRSYV